MKRFLIIAVLLMSLAACSQPTPTPSPNNSTPVPSDTLPVNTTVITSIEIEPIGAVVVDGTGLPLYVYIPDKNSEISTCVSECPNTYVPVIADDNVIAQNDLDENLIGVGGDGQVLYNGYLLYTYTGDSPDHVPSGLTTNFYRILPSGSVVGTL